MSDLVTSSEDENDFLSCPEYEMDKAKPQSKKKMAAAHNKKQNTPTQSASNLFLILSNINKKINKLR